MSKAFLKKPMEFDPKIMVRTEHPDQFMFTFEEWRRRYEAGEPTAVFWQLSKWTRLKRWVRSFVDRIFGRSP